jgi:ABC-type multidrug transport system fused ATPase/permease subunit
VVTFDPNGSQTSNNDFISAGYLAVGLTYSFQLTTYLKFLVRLSAQGEAQMNSVERIRFYMDNIPKEGLPEKEMKEDDPASSTILATVKSQTWPKQGIIEAKSIEMRYRDGKNNSAFRFLDFFFSNSVILCFLCLFVFVITL